MLSDGKYNLLTYLPAKDNEYCTNWRHIIGAVITRDTVMKAI